MDDGSYVYSAFFGCDFVKCSQLVLFGRLSLFCFVQDRGAMSVGTSCSERLFSIFYLHVSVLLFVLA